MAADSDNEMYDVTDSEEERELLAEKVGIGLIKVQAIQSTHRTSSQGLLAFEMCVAYNFFALHKPHWTAL